MRQFVQTDERYVEFRTIFDRQPNHESLVKELEEMSEDLTDINFWTGPISDEEEIIELRETGM